MVTPFLKNTWDVTAREPELRPLLATKKSMDVFLKHESLMKKWGAGSIEFSERGHDDTSIFGVGDF
jgi:hypothetical protein